MGGQDHPRIRGTNFLASHPSVYMRGSSPHTRDKLKAIEGHLFLPRIIPAYAGQIFLHFYRHNTIRDHPRIRGTNEIEEPDEIAQAGSSPHTRDKLSSANRFLLFHRIIPAYAGQIQMEESLHLINGDHPRIRGTNELTALGATRLGGSSPHTRDKSTYSQKCVDNLRIIPAYAGQI